MMENLEITSDSNNDLPIDYGLNGDNLDWQRRPSIYSSHMGTESIHWFNVLCYKNRVSCWDLDDSKPIRPVLDLPNSSFLPSLEEHSNLRADYIILVLRILIKHCSYFKQFSRLVPGHIPHQFILHKVAFGGDHLTVERGISATAAVSDSDTPFERLEGLILKHEDFHCEMNVLQVGFYCSNLFQLYY